MRFQKGQPKIGGRQAGSLNKATRDIRAIAQGLIEDPDYQAKLKERLYKGTSPTLEVLLHYYAYGKPKSVVDPNDRRVTIVVNRQPVPLNSTGEAGPVQLEHPGE